MSAIRNQVRNQVFMHETIGYLSIHILQMMHVLDEWFNIRILLIVGDEESRIIFIDLFKSITN